MNEEKKILLDPGNYRIHDDKNKRLIRKSLEECGAGRSIVLDKEDVIVAGNGVYEQARELGLKVRVIESDGSELIAIKRTDLSTQDERRKLLALADNHTSDTSGFDITKILDDFNPDDLDAWELDFGTDKDFSGKNKELELDLVDESYSLQLEYDSERYLKVKEALMTIDADPGKAVYKLLFEHE